MKVGIVGDATRTVAWEKHLRPHGIVSEVNLVPTIKDLDEVDACLILDDSTSNLDALLETVQNGYNCFLIAKQPTDVLKLERIHRATKESGVKVQFSHWPSLAPATQWMMDVMHRPQLLHFTRYVNRSSLVDPINEFRNLWIDELGLCIKWIDTGIHHIEAQSVYLDQNNPISIHLFLRFDNGSTASIVIYASSQETVHQRLACNKIEVLDCNVPSQTIRRGRLNEGAHLFFGKQAFDPAQAAEKAALLFLKSIQLNSEPAYSSYDAIQLAQQIQKVEQRLTLFS
ncbi:MAG: hypothetical protein ABJK11_15095 [Balneola sp.]